MSLNKIHKIRHIAFRSVDSCLFQYPGISRTALLDSKDAPCGISYPISIVFQGRDVLDGTQSRDLVGRIEGGSDVNLPIRIGQKFAALYLHTLDASIIYPLPATSFRLIIHAIPRNNIAKRILESYNILHYLCGIIRPIRRIQQIIVQRTPPYALLRGSIEIIIQDTATRNIPDAIGISHFLLLHIDDHDAKLRGEISIFSIECNRVHGLILHHRTIFQERQIVDSVLSPQVDVPVIIDDKQGIHVGIIAQLGD